MIKIYCDGACSGNPGPGGFGAIIWNLNHQTIQELGQAAPATTNNRMEMSASLCAIENVLRTHLPSATNQGEECIIFTDSKYLIQGISGWIFGWKKRGWKTAEGAEVSNRDLWERLDQAVKNARPHFKIIWKYVPGHQGYAGNERVDKIAVGFTKAFQGIESEPTLYSGPYSGYGINLDQDPPDAPITRTPTKKSDFKPIYLSLVGGELKEHATWAECEALVKGRPNVKYKKITSQQEYEDFLAKWS